MRQSELAKVRAVLESIEDALDQADIRLSKMKLSEGQHAALTHQKKKSLRRKKVEAEVQIEEKYRVTGLDVLLDTLGDLDERLEQENEAKTRCFDEARKVQQLNATKKAEIAQQLGGAINRINNVTADIQSVSQLAGNQCPTCRQMVEPDSSDRLLTLWDGHLKQFESERQRMEQRAARLEKKEAKSLRSIEKKRTTYSQEIDKLTNQRQILSDQIRKRENTLQLICQLEQQVFNLQVEMDQLDSRANPFTVLVEEINDELSEMSRDKRRWGYKEKSLDLELRHLLFWDHGFGNQGLKSYVLDNVVPFLTKRAQHYADILSGGDLRIEFSTQTQLKSGAWREQFQVKVTNRQGADVYAGNSDGEKRRIDIAVGWALGDLAATRAKKPIRFKGLDEVFSGLDETGEDAVIRLLHTVTGEYETVLCITHSDHLRSQFSNSLVVVKENGFSQIT
jgi:DNA repair exonuclease SbcCD ATPase subunit